MMRRICVVTGTRAEYGLLKPVMIAIQKHQKLELQLIVTGMHLVPEFGYTVKEIERDGFSINAKVDMLIASDSLSGMAKSIGVGIISITQVLEKLKPDIILVLGDRIETLAAAISAASMKIPLCHSGGGSSTGCIDNVIRHAITKFANVHFVPTSSHAKVLKRVGEKGKHIHVVGYLGQDTIKNTTLFSPREIAKKYSLNLDEPIFLTVFHPDTLDIKNSVIQAQNLCEALVNLNAQTIFIYPNADAGGRRILDIVKKYAAEHPKINLYENLPQIEYYSVMNIASIMIGNSSSGLTEAPTFKLPVINIGKRQMGRDKLCNVVDVSGETNDIITLAKKILTDTNYRIKLQKCKKPFGKGNAGEKMADILANLKTSKDLLYKSW